MLYNKLINFLRDCNVKMKDGFGRNKDNSRTMNKQL